MKTLVILLTLVALTFDGIAGFELSRSTFTLEQLEEAVQKAQSKDKPITFLVSDKDTTCGLCVSTSIYMMEELDRKTVMVYSRKSSFLPAEVRKLIEDQDTGKYIPYALIVSHDYSELISVVKYMDVKENSKDTFREVRKQLRRHKS